MTRARMEAAYLGDGGETALPVPSPCPKTAMPASCEFAVPAPANGA